MANTPFSVGHYRARNAQSAIRPSAQSTSASVTRNSALTVAALEDAQRIQQRLLLLRQQEQQQVQQQFQRRQQQQQLQPHVQQYQLAQQQQPAVTYPPTQPTPQANSDDVINIIRRFYDLIDPRMQKVDNDYKRLEAKIDLLLADREEAKIVEARQAKIIEAKLAVHKDLVEFLKRLEKVIGRSVDNNPGFSIMGRLDALDFSVGELLERARDPEANHAVPASVPAPPVRHEMAVSPRKKVYANASTMIDLFSPSPGPSTPRQLTAIETSSLRTRYSSDNNTVVGDTTMFDLTKQVQAINDKSPRSITLDLNSSRDNIPPVEPCRQSSPLSSGSRTQSCETNSRSHNSQDFSPVDWSQTTPSISDPAISTSTPKKVYPLIFHPTPIAHSKSCADVPEEGTIASLRLQTLGDGVCLEPSNMSGQQLDASSPPPAHPLMHSPANSRLLSPCLGGNEEDANNVEVKEDEDEQMADRDQQLLDEEDQTGIDNEDKEERSSSSTASGIAITANHPAPLASLICPSSPISPSHGRSFGFLIPPTESPNSTPKQKHSPSLPDYPSPNCNYLAQRPSSFSSSRTSQPSSSTPKRKSSPIKPEYMSFNHGSLAQRTSCSSPSASTRTPQLSSSVEDEQVVSELILASPTPTPIPNTQRVLLSQQSSLRLPSPPPSSPWAWASQNSTPRGLTALPIPPTRTSSSSSSRSPNKVGRSFAERPSNEGPSTTSTPQPLQFAYSTSSLSSIPNDDEEDEAEVVIASSCSPPPIESHQEYDSRVGEGNHGIGRTQKDEHDQEKNLLNELEIEGQDQGCDEENVNNLFALPTPEFEASPEQGGGPDVFALDDETDQQSPQHRSSSQSPLPTPSSLHPTSKIWNVPPIAQPRQSSNSPPRFPSVASPPPQDFQGAAASSEKPRQIHVPPKPPHISQEAIYLSSSPEPQPEVKDESHHWSSSFAESLSPLTDEESDSSLRARGFKPRYDDSDDAEIVPVKKRKITAGHSEPMKKKIEPGGTVLNLKTLLSKPGDSAAATKVVRKKRKVMVDDEGEEPPLKRAKDRLTMKEKEKGVKKDGSTTSLGTVKQEQKPKKKRVLMRSPSASEQRPMRSRRGKRKVKWPAMNELGDNGFHRKFIKCDLCFTWFHYGCVGITPTDKRLNPTEMFYCPPCDANGSSKKPARDTEATFCGRPDCDHREAPADEYFVAGIVGRKTHMTGGHGRLSKWLVKWDGYPIDQCTWEYENSMPDPQKLIEEFEEAATKEGIDLDADPYARVLLREVIEGGWSDPDEA